MSNRPGRLAQLIAAELRAELARQDRSRRWLADQIGQSHVTVSRWLKGDGPMSFDALDAICEVLGINVADLLVAVERQPAASAPRPPRGGGAQSDIGSDAAAAPSIDRRRSQRRKGSSPDTRRYRPLSLAA